MTTILKRLGTLGCSILIMTACSTTPPPKSSPSAERTARVHIEPEGTHEGREVVMYALGLLERDYRFGGNNPDTGLDCSGMVGYIYQQAVGLKLPRSAAQIAQTGQEIGRAQLHPGDLVFFNTMNRPYSHVGIYIGDNRFIHAPKRNSKISMTSLDNPYFSQRWNGGRRFFR